MLKRTLFASICVIAGVSPAFASFELLLVADNGANTTFSDRKIHRFDPVSGSYLGNFGGFNSAISNTHLVKATNSLFVTTTFETTEWDYNTGLLKASYSTSTSVLAAVNPSGTRIALFDAVSDFLVRNYPVTSSASILGAGGSQYRSGIFTSPTTIVAYDHGVNRFRTITTDVGVTTGSITQTTTTTLGPSGFGQMSFVGGGNFLVMPAGNTGQFHTYTPGSSASGTGTIPGGGTGLGAAAAHSGFFLSSTNAGVGRITAYTQNLSPIRQFGESVLINPVSMQSVLAPEPGSLLVMGLGALALLRRRRAA